jgi:hypothetical protein
MAANGRPSLPSVIVFPPNLISGGAGGQVTTGTGAEAAAKEAPKSVSELDEEQWKVVLQVQSTRFAVTG